MTDTIFPVITIDGPSGAGKGTVCQRLAARLGWPLLDSGAIYRVLALAALHHNVDLTDEEALVAVALAWGVAGAVTRTGGAGRGGTSAGLDSPRWASRKRSSEACRRRWICSPSAAC